MKPTLLPTIPAAELHPAVLVQIRPEQGRNNAAAFRLPLLKSLISLVY